MGLVGSSRKVRSVTVSGGGKFLGWVEYNGNKYLDETISVLSGESITAAGYTGKPTTIKLNGNNVANGNGVSYTMAVTSDTDVSISGTKNVKINITTA